MPAISVIRELSKLHDVTITAPADGDALLYDAALAEFVNGTVAGVSSGTFIFTQGAPSAVWVVLHNLGQYPSVSVVDSGGTVVIPDVAYASANQLTITFGSATSGKAYLN